MTYSFLPTLLQETIVMRTPFLLAAVATAGVASVTFYATKFQPDPRVLPTSAVDLSSDYSNIMPDDYVGDPVLCGVSSHATRTLEKASS